jgi:hypothetical protein
MPWRETDPRPERVPCSAASLSAIYTLTARCERFGIRRHTGYTGVHRTTTDGLSCSPLTGAEASSRCRLSGAARLSTQPVASRPSFARLCQEDGLPEAMRPDHGAPCAPPAFCGLCQLSVWWIQRGIRHQRLAPRRPEPHGAHARLPRTLNAEATRPPEPHQRAQQARFARCCHEDNAARPPEALDSRTPAALSRPSTRPMPAKRPEPADPGHYRGRRVSHAGTFRFQTRPRFLSETRRQEDIAWEDTADGSWSIDGDDGLLARLDERDFKLYAYHRVPAVPGLLCHRCFRLLHPADANFPASRCRAAKCLRCCMDE